MRSEAFLFTFGLLLLSGCRIPALRDEPWAAIRPQASAIHVRQPLYTRYELAGDVEVGVPQSSAIPFASTPSESGDIVGTYGLALGLQVYTTERLSITAAVDYRDFEIEEFQPLDPVPDLVDDPTMLVDGVPLDTDPTWSLQYQLGLRYLFDPFERNPRLRPYLEGAVFYVPSIEVSGTADLDKIAPGQGTLPFESVAGDYLGLSVGGGLAYQWSDRALLEVGLVHEFPLTPMDLDIRTDLFGVSIVSRGEFDPRGWILYAGLTWFY